MSRTEEHTESLIVLAAKVTMIPFVLTVTFSFLLDLFGPTIPPWPAVASLLSVLLSLAVGFTILARRFHRNRIWLAIVYFPVMWLALSAIGILLGYFMGWVEL